MAIRFLCGSCAQPIEVDEEWALKPVACPYCRKTVTAPVESQIDDAAGVPVARQSAEDAVVPVPPPVIQADVPPARNGAAIAAFVLACGVLACVASSFLALRGHGAEYRALQMQVQELMREGKGMFDSSQIAIDEQFGEDMPVGIAVASTLNCTTVPLWIAALICGIIGVCRPHRRGYAIFALSAVAAAPLLLCLGISAIML